MASQKGIVAGFIRIRQKQNPSNHSSVLSYSTHKKVSLGERMLHDATPSSSESAETARVHQQAWERALELRIALQRGLESANTLPAYPHFTQLSAGDEGASLMLVTELRKLFCSLASTLGDGGDRGSAAVSEEDDVEHMWTSLSTMHNECRQSWEGVIEKWHARLRFGSELSRSKLKVFGQTVFGAIDAALSDETRVLDKSRTPFHESTRMMRQLESSVSVPKRRRGDVDSEDEADETRVDPEVYDDRQTYALLLKVARSSTIYTTHTFYQSDVLLSLSLHRVGHRLVG